MRTPEDNHRSEEAFAHAQCVGELEKALQELNEGRNLKCWPLCSFGWKDADLDPRGCCGISKVTKMDDETVTLEIGGHKTFYDPSEEVEDEEKRSSYQEAAHTIVCSAEGNGDWTGDDWCWSFVEEVTVEWDEDGSIEATARAIIEAAEKVCEPYEDSWQRIDTELNSLAEQIEKEENGSCKVD